MAWKKTKPFITVTVTGIILYNIVLFDNILYVLFYTSLFLLFLFLALQLTEET